MTHLSSKTSRLTFPLSTSAIPAFALVKTAHNRIMYAYVKLEGDSLPVRRLNRNQ